MLTRRSSARTVLVRGYSLIELAVTLVVLALVLASVVPSAAEWMQDLRMRGVAESLKTGLDRARMEALKGNRTMSFWLVTDAKSKVPGADCELSDMGMSWVVSVDSPSKACNAARSTTAKPRLAYRSEVSQDGAQVTVEAVDADGKKANQVTFNALGQVQGVGMIRQVTVARIGGTGRTLLILVEPGGSVRTCDPKVSAGDPRACP
ncbi:GspH/FimT family protein [Roseateles sp. DB2]|uniref:GspH/FimT family protein n=1 Tax=Roseateles sp. DB2 TaxID=3453717 RepID=UPI003EEAB8CE